VALVVLANGLAETQAHDIYTDLRTKHGTPCCDHSDCRAAPYRIAAQGVEMLVGQEWVAVPAYAIQYRVLSTDSGETAGGHWCGRHVVNDPYEIGHFTFCAILPPRLAESSVLGDERD
jgi:hypothetical protein